MNVFFFGYDYKPLVLPATVPFLQSISDDKAHDSVTRL